MNGSVYICQNVGTILLHRPYYGSQLKDGDKEFSSSHRHILTTEHDSRLQPYNTTIHIVHTNRGYIHTTV